MFCVWGPLRAQVKGNLFNTGLLLPTFEEGTVCFCVWGPLRAQKRGKHLRRVVCVLCLGAPTGPREGETFFNTGPLLPNFEDGTVSFMSWEFCQSLYCIMFRVMKYVPFVWCQIDSGAKLTLLHSWC